MIYLRFAIVSVILQTVRLLPVEITKKDKKRSIDVYLKPFDIEYKPLDVLSDAPVSFQETIQFWNSLSDGPPNHGIVFTPFSGESGHHEDFISHLNLPQDYRDPYLLKGLPAKRAVLILYNKELFFGDIPHERSLLYNQEKRKMNGLSEHKLGSLRPNSPFFRGSYNF